MNFDSKTEEARLSLVKTRRVCWAVLIALLASAIGCGKKGAEPSNVSALVEGATEKSASKTFDPATAGSIHGAAFLDGPAPSLPAIDMQSEPACAKASQSAASARAVIVSSGGALANVVVYVKQGLGRYRFDSPKSPVVLDQKGCVYQPRIIALMTNQTLEISNSDATIHNVHAMPKTNAEWNKAQREGSPLLETSFPRPELAIPFMCNVHPWMRAFVFVFDHPYFAITDSAGNFKIQNLPPGTYTIEAWQEKLGARTQTVTVAAKESKEVSFRFTSGAASR